MDAESVDRSPRLPPAMAGASRVVIRETPLFCLPQRALWIPSLDALLVADLHWGKAATFRAAQIPVPMGTTTADLQRLTIALHGTAASRLIILGDLLHAATGWHASTEAAVAQWRDRHPLLDITLVRGNHDQRAGDPPSTLGIQCIDGPINLGPFLGMHEPAPGSDDHYVLCGHVHPSASLRGRGRQSLRLPAFVVGASRVILPAFSSFTGTGMYQYETGDRLYAIAGDEVVPVRGSEAR